MVKEVKADNLSYKECEKIMMDYYNLFSFDDMVKEKKYPSCIFIVNSKEKIQKDIDELYSSLPISTPFEYSLKSRVTDYITSFEHNDKQYNNYTCLQSGVGTMYFVEKKDVIDVSNKRESSIRF
jgi:hypothetical protein